jgi:hypothetical protein
MSRISHRGLDDAGVAGLFHRARASSFVDASRFDLCRRVNPQSSCLRVWGLPSALSLAEYEPSLSTLPKSDEATIALSRAKKKPPGGGPLTIHTLGIYVCYRSPQRKRDNPQDSTGVPSVREKRRPPPSLAGASLVLGHDRPHATQIGHALIPDVLPLYLHRYLPFTIHLLR